MSDPIVVLGSNPPEEELPLFDESGKQVGVYRNVKDKPLPNQELQESIEI